MRRLRLMLAAAFVACVVPLVVASPALAAGGSGNNVYSFDLVSANTASSPSGGTMMASPGDWISVTGSGTFDPAARTVTGGGSFVHYSSNGTVHCQGTWKATGYVSFIDFGTNQGGQEGGMLALVTTHHCTTMGMTMTGIPMTVTSTVKAPAGSSYVEGITVCDFTKPTGGKVVMQPEQ